MAHADYDFYKYTFHGDVLPDYDAEKWLERASDELDHLTFDRLHTAFPTDELYAGKVRKAVCAIAEALFRIEEQRAAASAQKAADGTYRGAVASISSGRESVSYAVSGAAAASVYAQAAANTQARTSLISDIAVRYLANVPDSNDVNLLYAGRCTE